MYTHFLFLYISIFSTTSSAMGFFGGSDIKNLPAVRKTQDWSLGWEDPLEKGMATHSSILAWRIPQTEETGSVQSMGLQRVGHYWVTNTISRAMLDTLDIVDVMPDVRIPEREERRLPRQCNSQKREVYYWLEPGLSATTIAVMQGQKALNRGGYPNL